MPIIYILQLTFVHLYSIRGACSLRDESTKTCDNTVCMGKYMLTKPECVDKTKRNEMDFTLSNFKKYISITVTPMSFLFQISKCTKKTVRDLFGWEVCIL